MMNFKNTLHLPTWSRPIVQSILFLLLLFGLFLLANIISARLNTNFPYYFYQNTLSHQGTSVLNAADSNAPPQHLAQELTHLQRLNAKELAHLHAMQQRYAKLPLEHQQHLQNLWERLPLKERRKWLNQLSKATPAQQHAMRVALFNRLQHDWQIQQAELAAEQQRLQAQQSADFCRDSLACSLGL